MNDQQLNRSEKIAAGLMRVFAIIGLIAVLAFIAWMVVQGFRFMPRAGEGLGAAVNALTAVFRDAPEESIVFDLDDRTVRSGEAAEIAYLYNGPAEAPSFSFSYECVDGVSMSIMSMNGWTPLTCGAPFVTEDEVVSVLFDASMRRFNQVEVYVAGGDVSDTTLVTVVNMDLADGSTVLDDMRDDEQGSDSPSTDEPSTPAVTPSTPVTRPVPAPVTPVVRKPADLAINIVETGILVEVSGTDTFFPVSPIPNDKVAAVRFTVTNLGDMTAAPFAFRAALPIEGDRDYSYQSPAQEALLPGKMVEYTLGFDQLVDARDASIGIVLYPSGDDAVAGNNADAVKIEIK